MQSICVCVQMFVCVVCVWWKNGACIIFIEFFFNTMTTCQYFFAHDAESF